MRNPKFAKPTLLFLFTLTFVAFQNCEDVSFQDMSEQHKPMNPIGSDSDRTQDVIQVEIEVDNSKVFIDDPEIDDILTQEPDDLADTGKDSDEIADQDSRINLDEGNNLDENSGDGKVSESAPAELVEEFVNICNEVDAKSSHSPKVLNDSSLIGFRGHAYFLSGDLESVSDVRGSLRLVADSGKRSIGIVSDIAGNILICGYDVESINSKARGNIIVVGGNIGSIENLHGNLTVIDGEILGGRRGVKGKINIR